MTNTTRTLTFRHEPGSTILFRASTDHAAPGLPLAVTTGKGDFPTWSMLDADAVEELHELTGLILKGRDRVIDTEILCGATKDQEKLGDSEIPTHFECCLDDGHRPVLGDPTKHVTSDGWTFSVAEDRVVDAPIMCGAQYTDGDTTLKCCLAADHGAIMGNYSAHITLRGVTFVEAPPI